jgi:WD40 repeat protein
MKQKVLTFDGRSLGGETVEAPGRLRWACWNRMDGSALLVGDRGTVISYVDHTFSRLDAGSDDNLRCSDFSPREDSAYACGNSGLILRIEGGRTERLKEDVRENLRRVAWDPAGTRCLFVGNNGAAYVRSASKFEVVQGADTHLRSIAWHPRDGYALVAGNCFRDSVGGLSPSPNLFKFEQGSLEDVSTLAESRADLVATSWKADGSSCLLTGFDQTWHTPSLLSYDGETLVEIVWGSENIFPTACAWHPSGEYALVGTSALTPDEGTTALYKFDGKTVTKISELGGFGVSCIAWSAEGVAIVVAPRSIRAFSV